MSSAVCEPIGIAAEIQTLIQIVGDIGEADGIDIEDSRGVGISAHAGRIAGDADEIADAAGMGAEQLALDAEGVAVAAAEVEHGFDPGLLLDELAGDLRAQTGAGTRAVGDVDAIDAGGFAEAAPAISFEASTPRGGRISTKATNCPGGELRAQSALVRDRNLFHRS